MNLGAGGDLVSACLGGKNSEDPNWLGTWIQASVEKHILGPLSESGSMLPFGPSSDLSEAAHFKDLGTLGDRCYGVIATES